MCDLKNLKNSKQNFGSSLSKKILVRDEPKFCLEFFGYEREIHI